MDEFLTLQEAAAKVHRHPRWIRRRLRAIRHYKPPSAQILIRQSDLFDFMEKYVIEPENVSETVEKILRGNKRRKGRGNGNGGPTR